LGERHANSPGAHHAGDSDSHGESTGARRVSDHVEEARALLDKPGTVRLEEGATEEGGEGRERAESLSGNGAMAGAECDQVAEAAVRGEGGGGGGQCGRAAVGGS
jgi:hypothetical protein